MEKQDRSLFLVFVLWALVQSVYLLIRMHIVSVAKVNINILGQLEPMGLRVATQPPRLAVGLVSFFEIVIILHNNYIIIIYGLRNNRAVKKSKDGRNRICKAIKV